MDGVPPVVLKHDVHLKQAQCVLRRLLADTTFTDLILQCQDQAGGNVMFWLILTSLVLCDQ